MRTWSDNITSFRPKKKTYQLRSIAAHLKSGSWCGRPNAADRALGVSAKLVPNGSGCSVGSDVLDVFVLHDALSEFRLGFREASSSVAVYSMNLLRINLNSNNNINEGKFLDNTLRKIPIYHSQCHTHYHYLFHKSMCTCVNKIRRSEVAHYFLMDSRCGTDV